MEKTEKKRKVTLIMNEGKPFIADKTGRNEKCRCGSGLKAKKCCGTKTKYYLSKPKPKNQSHEN